MKPMALYGVKAIRWDGNSIAALEVGLINPNVPAWDAEPAEMSLNDAIHIVTTDKLVTIWPDGTSGPNVHTVVAADGTESLAADDWEVGVKALRDLPTF